MHLVPIISTGTYRWLQLRMGLLFSKDNVKTCHLTRVNSAIGATSRIVRIRDAIRSPANFHSYLRITIRAAKSTMLMTALDLVKLFSRDWKDSGIDCTSSCSPSHGMSRPFVLELNTNAGVQKQDVKLMRLVIVPLRLRVISPDLKATSLMTRCSLPGYPMIATISPGLATNAQTHAQS